MSITASEIFCYVLVEDPLKSYEEIPGAHRAA